MRATRCRVFGHGFAGLLACAGTLLGGCATSSVSSPSSAAPAAESVAITPDANPFRIGRPLVIPHGGGDGLFPEDTLYAYQHSIALGGDVVDMDVLLSSDGIPIAFHDGTLERTTNGTGEVESKTYAQLSTLDAGYNFTLGTAHPFRGQGLTIPTIESVLIQFPQTLVTLDLKDPRIAAVEPLCSMLRRLGRTHDVYIGVDEAAQVDLFRRDCPEVRTSGTDAERAAMRAARDAHDASYVTTQLVSQPQYIGPDGTIRVTADSLASAHSKDIAVLTWVVDDPIAMKTLIDMGIDGIYTRRPDVLVALEHTMGLR